MAPILETLFIVVYSLFSNKHKAQLWVQLREKEIHLAHRLYAAVDVHN